MQRLSPDRSRSSAPQRRGFLIVTILVLLVISTMTIGWGLQRAAFQNRVTELRLQDYRLHHERLGVIALSTRWFSRTEVKTKAREIIDRGGIAYRASLPNDTLVEIALNDGQGGVLARIGSAENFTMREQMIEALRRLPPDRPDLVRAYGPTPVSLRAAPDEVLEAIAGEYPDAVETLKRLREEPPTDQMAFRREFTSLGLDDHEAVDLMGMFTAEPSLFRIDAQVTDQFGSRRYEVLIEIESNLLRVHSCRRYTLTEVAQMDSGEDPRDRPTRRTR